MIQLTRLFKISQKNKKKRKKIEFSLKYKILNKILLFYLVKKLKNKN